MVKYRDLEGIYYSDGEKIAEEVYKRRLEGEATYVFDVEVNGFQGFSVNSREVIKLIDNINSFNLALNKITDELPVIACISYIKKCLIDEIKVTGEIEGVSSTRREIGQIIDDIQNNNIYTKRKRLYGLVQKYMMLMGDEDIPLSNCKNIRSLYEDLVWSEIEEDNPNNLPDGEIFRKEDANVINTSQKVIHVGVRSESKIVDYMNKLINILNDDEYNYFVRVAVAHYLIGYIHPFYDGNGRLSRFISSYMLSKKLNYLISFGLSLTIKENIKTYYKMFVETNKDKNKGELTIFVINFLDIIQITMSRILEELREKQERLNFYEQRFCEYSNEIKISPVGRNVCWILIQNQLFGENGLSLKEIKENLGETISESNLRLHIRGIKSILIEEQNGRTKSYGIDLSKFE